MLRSHALDKLAGGLAAAFLARSEAELRPPATRSPWIAAWPRLATTAAARTGPSGAIEVQLGR